MDGTRQKSFCSDPEFPPYLSKLKLLDFPPYLLISRHIFCFPAVSFDFPPSCIASCRLRHLPYCMPQTAAHFGASLHHHGHAGRRRHSHRQTLDSSERNDGQLVQHKILMSREQAQPSKPCMWNGMPST